jgi:hypothetical protein
VPAEDLRSIPGLQENHRRELAAKLAITSLRALADADQRTVYEALRNIRPRPSLTRIAAWQSDARGRLPDAVAKEPDWRTSASFAVIFAQRQVNGVWEHRIEAEQTEVEPALEPRQWPGWDCGPLCDWMLGQLGRPAGQADPEAGVADGAGAATTAEPAARTAPARTAPARTAPARTARAELRIDSATITDAVQELELIRAGNVVAAPAEALRPPVRLSVTVTGARSGQHLQAAVWFRRPAGPGWSPHDPVRSSPSGRAEFDLSSVPPGGHDARLLAWATDAGATLAAVTLPTLTWEAVSAS